MGCESRLFSYLSMLWLMIFISGVGTWFHQHQDPFPRIDHFAQNLGAAWGLDMEGYFVNSM